MAYIVLLVPSVFLAAVIWSWVAPDRFYYCWDDAPLITFIPPFVHPDFPLNQRTFDYYVLPARTVYFIWVCFVATAALLPAVPVVLFQRLWRGYERRGLFMRHRASPDDTGIAARGR